MDGTGTVATEDRLKQNNEMNGTPDVDEPLNVPINENLFLDEDLDALDEELKDLELQQ